MVITKNKMVSLTYDLRVEGVNGELIEQATSARPLAFVFGAGVMLPRFEALIEGMEQGKPFNIELKSNEAYGEVDEDAIVELPKHIFIVEGQFDEEIIKIGNTVPMMSTDGRRMNGLVLEITGNAVKMDFNHPLAGEDLFFSGEILEVRDATEEEIEATKGGCGGGCECGSECHSDEHGEACACETDGGHGAGCGCKN